MTAKVSEIMTPTILTIDVETPVTGAAKKMREFDIGFLAVVSDLAVIGTFTDRDMVIRALAEEKDVQGCYAPGTRKKLQRRLL